MQDDMTPERYRAEISMLNHEIYELSRKLDASEGERLRAVTSDKTDPFANPTDYPGFTGNYKKILPRLGEPGFRIPLEPEATERRNLRRLYSIGGWCFIFQFVLANTGAFLLNHLIASLISGSGTMTASQALEYMNTSSITAGVSMLVYMVFNVTVAFLGMNWAGINRSSLLRTRGKFSTGKALKYCLAALFIWVVMLYACSGIGAIFSKFGYSIKTVSTADMADTPLSFAVTAVYTAMIAPITEEIFFRGMLLRVFSRANQRFAVVATAFFFAIGHKNIPQFLMAFAIGLFLAHITLIHGSVIPSIIVHIFINCFAAVVQQFSGAASDVKLALELVVVAVAMVGAITLLVFMGSEKLPTPTPAQARRGFPLATSSLMFGLAAVIPTAYSVYLLIMSNR